MQGRGTRALVVLALAVVTGCAGMQGSFSTERAGDPALVLVADTETIARGGSATLTITARNRTFETMDFGQGSSSCWFGVRIVDVSSGRSMPSARACTRDYVSRHLEPGNERTETVTWRASMHVEGASVDLPPGMYELRATAAGRESAPVTIEVVDASSRGS